MFKVRAKIIGLDNQYDVGYPCSIHGSGIDSLINNDGMTLAIETDSIEVVLNDYSPYNQGQSAWNYYVLFNEKPSNPFKEGTESFSQWQSGWNQNFNGINKTDLKAIKTNELISKYRLFITLLVENDCIKGIGTIQTAKELLRKI